MTKPDILTFYKTIIFSMMLTFGVLSPVFGANIDQLNADNSSGLSSEQIHLQNDARVALALTSSEYPVTPGDIYLISFLRANEETETTCSVELDNSINLGYLGVFQGAGKAFLEIKSEILESLYESYGECYPRVTILSTGTFRIWVSGEVNMSRYISMWGLSRVSEIIDQVKTEYTSLRNITLENQNTRTAVDLYKAWYEGERAQDPLIRPNTNITFNRAEKQVVLEGACYRPGGYEIFADETLQDVIENYGRGLIDFAYEKQIVINRLTSNDTISGGKTFYIDLEQGEDLSLRNNDLIKIRSRSDFLPTFFFQGAITSLANKSEASTYSLNFYDGALLSSLAMDQKDLFTEDSDLEHAVYFCVHDSSSHEIDLSEIIYKNNVEDDRVIHNGDKLFIPTRHTYN